MKTAFITGVTGQDGSYLSELLLDKEYTVIGGIRRSSVDTKERIAHLLNNERFKLIECDVTDRYSLDKIFYNYPINEVYMLAAQSHVQTSFTQPQYTFDVNTIGILNVINILLNYPAKLYWAGTSEMLGGLRVGEKYNELTPFKPCSPYGVSKIAAYYLMDIYRKTYGIFACSGWLSNHESERRGENFVTRKISKYVAKLNKYMEDSECEALSEIHGIPSFEAEWPGKLKLGNPDAMRDWGYAPEFVNAMYLMLQQDKPDDYVIATGETHTVREFVEEAFNCIGVTDYEQYIEWDNIDNKRPCELDYLCGDYTKAKEKLGWEPKVKFKELVHIMVKSDIKLCHTQ